MRVSLKFATIWQFLFSVLLLATYQVRAEQPQKFLVFDQKLSGAWIKSHANEYVFVWGAKAETVPDFIAMSPHTELSSYFPYSRDPDRDNSLAKWQVTHNTWIAYKCNKAPAVFVGDANIPLDINNPDVVKWQIKNFVKGAKATRVVALDNFQFRNVWGVCGSRTPNGGFSKRYDGRVYDDGYASDVIAWLEKVSAALHEEGMKVVVNHIPDSVKVGRRSSVDMSSSLTRRLVAAVDGMVDERADYILSSKGIAEDIFQYSSYADKEGKWLYFIYQLDPLDADSAQSAVASYLMMASERTAMFLSQVAKSYGGEPKFFGYDRSVGKPCGARMSRDGLLIRQYDHGLAIFALPEQPGGSMEIPSGYKGLNDRSTAGGRIDLSAGEGRIFYRAEGDGCSIKVK